MEHGDISIELRPRLLIEFEDLIGHRPSTRTELLARKFGRWKKLVDDFELDDLVIKVMYDLTWRLNQEIDVITHAPDPFAEYLAARFEIEDIPARRVWHYEPRRLARRLISMPFVAAVYTPSLEHAMLYGSRGRHVTPENVTQMGRF